MGRSGYYRFFVASLLVAVFCSFVSSCENLPDLRLENLQDENKIQIDGIEDILDSIPLVGGWQYLLPGEENDHKLGLIHRMSFKQKEDQLVCLMEFELCPETNGCVLGYYQVLRLDSFIVEQRTSETGELQEICVLYPGADWSPLVRIWKDTAGYVVAQYQLAPLLNLYYSYIMEPMDDDYLKYVLWKEYKNLSEVIGPVLSTIYSPSEITVSDNYEIQTMWISLCFFHSSTGEGYTCVATPYFDHRSKDDWFPTNKYDSFVLPYIEVDAGQNEIRCYYSKWDTLVPYMRIVYYPVLKRIVLYWRPGVYFDEFIKTHYSGSLFVPELINEELQIELSPDRYIWEWGNRNINY